ncbi:MAG: FAD-dependent oxidoreductase, partial [Polyangiales bacterium]
MTTVAILGGGVAGMTAAHELVERGFTVRVFEAKPVAGG